MRRRESATARAIRPASDRGPVPGRRDRDKVLLPLDRGLVAVACRVGAVLPSEPAVAVGGPPVWPRRAVAGGGIALEAAVLDLAAQVVAEALTAAWSSAPRAVLTAKARNRARPAAVSSGQSAGSTTTSSTPVNRSNACRCPGEPVAEVVGVPAGPVVAVPGSHVPLGGGDVPVGGGDVPALGGVVPVGGGVVPVLADAPKWTMRALPGRTPNDAASHRTVAPGTAAVTPQTSAPAAQFADTGGAEKQDTALPPADSYSSLPRRPTVGLKAHAA